MACIPTLIHDLALTLNNKSQCDVILFDFSKAFDRVPHCHLFLSLNIMVLGTLFYYGFNPFYLSNHTQQVICGSSCSNTANAVSGVPLGSVLGACCFYFMSMTSLTISPQHVA